MSASVFQSLVGGLQTLQGLYPAAKASFADLNVTKFPGLIFAAHSQEG